MGRADRKGGEAREQQGVGGLREDELQGAERRLAELEGGERARAVFESLDGDRLARLASAAGSFERGDRRGGSPRPGDPGQQRVAVLLVAPDKAGQCARRL